ncbi:hypothetical protein CEQ51_15905 [Pseudomonas thivervalensis]|uniref:Nucleoid-structuring protein H-NS n=1 Tax=Pseudomonas thivervalensis TaxID=86265 RepID=A0A2Z4ZW51_9PSED|nr:hypothetical protein CE140_15350 [Pseudomonas thivervalensis]AXA61501.1 hypothetical protein CEQ51_15905 [Pseudomonas thivervalensis]
MAQRGYLGIHAEVPTAQCLRSAIVVNGAPRSKAGPRRPYSRPGSPGHIPIHCGSEPAREGGLVAGLSLTNVPDQLCVGLFVKVA